MNSLVTDLELSKQLCKANIIKDAEFKYWKEHTYQKVYMDNRAHDMFDTFVCYAPTAEEVLRVLPKKITIKDVDHYFECGFNRNGEFLLHYTCANTEILHMMRNSDLFPRIGHQPKLSNACAKMALCLKAEGLINP